RVVIPGKSGDRVVLSLIFHLIADIYFLPCGGFFQSGFPVCSSVQVTKSIDHTVNSHCLLLFRGLCPQESRNKKEDCGHCGKTYRQKTHFQSFHFFSFPDAFSASIMADWKVSFLTCLLIVFYTVT